MTHCELAFTFLSVVNTLQILNLLSEQGSSFLPNHTNNP